ncbi:MAG TPA: hypothetical protein VK968_06655, partial [Roseimicrobium sp.]|nr:hypothetical protein [Roseimicrobium sp.]
MSDAHAISNVIAARVGWTLVHFGWQACVAAGLLKLSLFVLRHHDAAKRYLVAVVCLGILSIAPIVTFALTSNSQMKGAVFFQSDLSSAGHQERIKAAPWADSWSGAVAKVGDWIAPCVVPAAYTWMVGLIAQMTWQVIAWRRLERLLLSAQIEGS